MSLLVRIIRPLLPLVLLSTCMISEGIAQENTESVRRYSPWLLAAGNIGIGALTSGLSRLLVGKPPTRAAAYGAVGGALSYGGKAVVARNSGIANLLGRQLSAVGSSLVANASAARSPASHIALPWGPFRLHVEDLHIRKSRIKLDLASTVALIDAIGDRDLDFRAGMSLSHGVPIFKVDWAKNSGRLGGSHLAGVVRYRPKTRFLEMEAGKVRSVIGHELVHALQRDFAFNVWAAPLEDYVFARMPGGKVIGRYVDIGLDVPMWSVLNVVTSYDARPWEREAVTLEKR